MFGWLSKKRRVGKAWQKEPGQLASVFASLEKLEEVGMLAFDVKNRRLFVEQPLALVMMRDAEAWQNFIRNVFLWLYYRQCQEAWDAFLQREELKAVREATKKYALMTRADIERVKRARREEVVESDVKAPRVEPFEFFVIREVAVTQQQTGQEAQAVPGGEILAVGNYNPDTEALEMATWEEVKIFLEK